MVYLKIDMTVVWNDRSWVIQDFNDLETVRLQLEDGLLVRNAKITDLHLPNQFTTGHTRRVPLQLVPPQEMARAETIFQAIKPLLSRQRNTKSDIESAADKIGCVPSRVYQYVQTWRKHKRLSALVRKPRNDKGKSRLSPEVKAVIDEVIEEYYKTLEQPDEADTLNEVRLRCGLRNLHKPSLTPVRAAIAALPQKEKAKARKGAKHARETFEPTRGSFPNAEYPLAVVQIDHTPVDIILVDEDERKPLSRPTLTIVIDVCTRMLMGFCLTLEAPGALNTALALTHAILPKDTWLKDRGFDVPWPIHGIPGKVHVDNAKEFRGTALSNGCAEHDITLENRPKGLPNYGGNVERAFRSFMKATHRVKGTTFSNVVKKADYDSEGRAILTVREFEQWFTIFILYRYHHKRHKGIGYPPITYYKLKMLGDENSPPIGLPQTIADPRRLLLDFLPITERTIQKTGVEFEKYFYWEDILRKWVGAVSPNDPKKARKFQFAYDPRDLSFLYFLDPDTNEYFPIPYRDKGLAPISKWEREAANRKLASDPERRSNEEMIHAGILKGRELEEQAEKDTKSARISKARRKAWSDAQKQNQVANKASKPKKTVLDGYASHKPALPEQPPADDDGDIGMPTFVDL